MRQFFTIVIAVFLVLSFVNILHRYSTFFTVQARSCADDCHCEASGDPDNPDPDCAPGALCRPDGCTVPAPPNVCCVSGSSASVCVGEPVWTYFHNAECIVDSSDPVFFETYCSYHWQRDQCPATDSCMGQTGLRPGKCTSDGCAIGTSIYKTCCNAYGQAVTCNGGEYTGICTPNQTVWGTGQSSDCAGSGSSSSAPPGSPTITPIPQGCEGSNWGGPCSNWNGNASGCWSNGQFNGLPSCGYCADTGVCACGGACPPPGGTPVPTQPPAAACSGTCLKSNPYDPDDVWHGGTYGYSQCDSVYRAGHYQWWPGGTSGAPGNAGDSNCAEQYGSGFNKRDACCGPMWPAPTPVTLTASPLCTNTNSTWSWTGGAGNYYIQRQSSAGASVFGNIK